MRTAVINKRAGGMGLILVRKAFQKPLAGGVALLNAIQDVYLLKDVTVAQLRGVERQILGTQPMTPSSPIPSGTHPCWTIDMRVIIFVV